MRQPGAPTPVALPYLVQHWREAQFRAVASGFSLGVVKPLISQRRHDLTRWQCGVLGLVAGQKDWLALLLAKPLRNQTVPGVNYLGGRVASRSLLPV